MEKIKYLIFAICILVISGCEKKEVKELWIASGAGYKKPVLEISQGFTNSSGINISPVFGNMQAIATQVKQSAVVNVVIGDKKFLDNKNLGVEYDKYTTLGFGKLVLAYSKKVELTTLEDILSKRVNRISMPDVTNAIYGKAAMELLTYKDYYKDVKDKIIISSTVLQVSSYLVSGEIDAGFINLTDAIGLQDKIGGYIILSDGYSPIEIVAGTVKGSLKDKNTDSFIKYLSTSECQKILGKYGLI